MSVELEEVARLSPLERALVEKLLARGGRAALAALEAELDQPIDKALERLSRRARWLWLDADEAVLDDDALDLLGSSIAGVPPLRRRPIVRGSLGDLDEAREDRVIARARAAGPHALALLDEVIARGGVAPLAALPRELRQAALEPALEAARVVFVGRLDLRPLGIAFDLPAALAPREIVEARAAALAAGAAPGKLAAASIAGLLAPERALALARAGELRATRAGKLDARSRARLAQAAKLVATPFATPDELAGAIGGALVASGVLRLTEDGALSPSPRSAGGGALEHARSLLHAVGDVLGREDDPPAAAILGRAAREACLAMPSAWVGPDLAARTAVHRALDAGFPASAPSGPPMPLEDAVALAFGRAVPAAAALGLLDVELDASSLPLRARASGWLDAVRSTAPADAKPLLLAADGDATVLPGPGALDAALLLARWAEPVALDAVPRFRLTLEAARGARARGHDPALALARLGALARGELPPVVARMLGDDARETTRARVRSIFVLEVERAAAADRAAQVLGPAVRDRLTPTVLVLEGTSLTLAQRRALAREGIYVD